MLLCSEQLSTSPGDDGYEAEMQAAVGRLTDKLADEMKGMYERHRHVIPGWENRPLVIH